MNYTRSEFPLWGMLRNIWGKIKVFLPLFFKHMLYGKMQFSFIVFRIQCPERGPAQTQNDHLT